MNGGGGVKNLLAMFEKGASAPASPKTPPANREVSPAPKPLGRVRTSFVAVNSKDGTGIGLQKLPLSPSSPAVADVNTLNSPFGPALVSDATPQDNTDPVKQGETLAQAAEPKTEDPSLVPQPEEADAAKAESPVERPAEAQENAPPKAAKAEDKASTKDQPKKVAPKKEPVKKEKATSKSEAASNKTQTKPTSTTKTTKAPVPKSLSVQAASSKATPPAPKSPGKAPTHSRTASRDSIAKPRSKPISSKPPTKPQEPVFGVAPKSKTAVVHKPVPKPDPKEATKPAELKGTAFAPTASWVAKMGGVPAEAAPRRPPSSTSMNRTSRSTERTVRRQKSLVSVNKETTRQSRPATAAAHHYPPPPPPPSSDFLSRMTRPTKSSASKVTEKVDTSKHQPALRTGSSMGSSSEPHSPPRVKKTHSPNRISREIPKLKLEGNSESGFGSEAASPTRKTHFAVPHSESEPEPIPEEAEEETPAVEQKEQPGSQEELATVVIGDEKGQAEPQEVSSESAQPEVEVVEKKTPELSINTENIPHEIGKGDDGETPTTTSSSATLVQEGDGLDDPKEGS